MKEDMRNLFIIIKGQYLKGVFPRIFDSVTGDTHYIGGFNPTNENTVEWYQALDRNTFHTISCGQDLNTVLTAIKVHIKTYKGKARNYYKALSKYTTEDYYETHYLGHSAIPYEQKRKSDKCCGVSEVMKSAYLAVLNTYGDFYRDQIAVVEDEAYEELVDNNPISKARKLHKKRKLFNLTHKVQTPQVVFEYLEKPVFSSGAPKIRKGVLKPKKRVKLAPLV